MDEAEEACKEEEEEQERAYSCAGCHAPGADSTEAGGGLGGDSSSRSLRRTAAGVWQMAEGWMSWYVPLIHLWGAGDDLLSD
jgi:mono/diheme cytochrome c family protein